MSLAIIIISFLFYCDFPGGKNFSFFLLFSFLQYGCEIGLLVEDLSKIYLFNYDI